MPVYGQRPDDVVTDTAGNVQSGVTLTLHATEADAIAGTNVLASPTVTAGRWTANVAQAPVWVRAPGGAYYKIEDFGSKLDTATANSTIATAVAPKLTGVAQNTAPASSAGVWIDTGSTVPAPTADTIALLAAADNFTRADSATVLGSPTIGPAWQALRGTWGISGNAGYLATHDAVNPANDTAVIDAASADVIIRAKMVSGAPGLCVRVTDAGNGFVTNLTALYRRETEANNLIGNFTTALVAGDTMRIVAKGTTIKVYRQAASAGPFAEVYSATGQTFNQTATKHGVRTSSAATIDDFSVHALVPA